MRIYSKTILLACLSLIFVPACNSDQYFEDPRPQEAQWVNTTTFDQGLSSAYRNLFYNCLNGLTMMFDFGTSGTSQLLPETTTSVPWNEMYNWKFEQNHVNFDNVWTNAYKTITMCNMAIELDSTGLSNPFRLDVAGTDYSDNYRRQVGEYYFLRAYAYYTLLRTFAAPYVHNAANEARFIPFKTRVPRNKDDIYSAQLGTNAEIYEQVVRDLQKAKNLLPENYKASTMLPSYQVGRATKYAASALLGKALFLMGRYEQAETEFTFIIDAAEKEGKFSLDAPIDAFNKINRLLMPRETILEFDSGNPTIASASQYMYWGMIISLNFRDAFGGGRGKGMVKSTWNQFTMSYWALNKMKWMKAPESGDYTITEAARSDLRFQQLYYHLLGYKSNGDPFLYETLSAHAAVTTPQVYVDKYFRGGAENSDESGRYTKFPLIRLGDIYLLRSWISWHKGDKAPAANDLNKVWNRANPSSPNRYSAGNTDHDAIFAEYLREMSGEGWIVDFMMATQMDIPAGDRKNLSPLTPPYTIWHWAIPVAEVNLNPAYY